METRNQGLHIHKQGEVGFTKIYTPAFPPAFDDRPDQHPYIIFKIPKNTKSNNYLIKQGLLNLGLVSVDEANKTTTIVVTGNRKVSIAIDLFLKDPKYSSRNNQILFNYLIKYKNECDKKVAKKKIKMPPPKSKENNFSDVKNISHRAREVEGKENKRYVLKEYPHKRSVTELEAFNGSCMRLLLGDRHPKVRPVHDSEGKRFAVISKIFDFTSFRNILDEDNTPLSKKYLVESELVKVLIAAICEEEGDINIGNYGPGNLGFIKKIDPGQSTWSLISVYEGVPPELGIPHTLSYVPPVKAFPVTERDIINFPYLQDAQPKVWVTHQKTASDQKPIHLFDNLPEAVKDKKFIDDKFYMLLKRILIPDEAYQAIGKAMIRSDKKRKKFVEHKCKKTKDLKNVLLNMPEFKDYVVNHPNAIQQILSEFEEYNKDYKSEKDKYLHVNLEKIQKNFNDVHGNITGFFSTHSKYPLARDVVIGTLISLAILGIVLGALAITAATHGVGTIPYLVGIGKGVAVIGTALSGGALAAGSVGAITAGLGAVGGVIVLTISTFAGVTGAIVRKVFGTKNEKTPENIPEKNLNETAAEVETPKNIYENKLENISEEDIEESPIPIGNVNPNSEETFTVSQVASQSLKLSSSRETFYAQNIQQNDIDDINKVVDLLKTNIAFISAWNEGKELLEWVLAKQNEELSKANNTLAKRLGKAMEYSDKLFAEFKEAMYELKNGKQEPIQTFLAENTKLRNALKNNMSNPVITAWYEDHPQYTVRQTISL